MLQNNKTFFQPVYSQSWLDVKLPEVKTRNPTNVLYTWLYCTNLYQYNINKKAQDGSSQEKEEKPKLQ